MRTRCLNPRAANYFRYGGRGITICERWDNFENFLSDMGRKPSPIHSLDRIDGSGHYSPDNCRWATPKEQSRNIRTNHRLTFNGETRTCIEWAELIGLKETTLNERLRHGWTVQRALTEPLVDKAAQARKMTKQRLSECYD
jgi:hypothetical protein